MVPGTRVNAGLDKEKGQNLITKEARVVPTGRNGKEGKGTEYSSNGAGKADPSQGLDNPQNSKPQATGSGLDGQPGGTQPGATTARVATKATDKTGHGSEQEGVPAGRFSEKPYRDPETEQEPPGAGVFLSKSA